MKLEFTKEDFSKWKPHALSGPDLDFQDMADLANERLQEMLAEAPVVSTEIHNPDALSFTWDLGIGRKATHTARLVDIRELKP